MNGKRISAMLGLIFTAAIFGITPHIIAAAGETSASPLFLLTASSLIGGILLLLGFRGSLKQDGFFAFRHGILPGLLLFGILVCLRQGSYGIVWSLSLPLIFAIEQFGTEQSPSIKSIAALIFLFGGMLILTDTVRVELFPFSFAVTLPGWETRLLWQIAGAVLSVCFLYIGKRTASNCASASIAAGAVITVGMIALFLWCFTEKAALPAFDGKLLCLLAWWTFVRTLGVLLILCGVRHCRIIPCKAALSLALAAELLFRLLLANGFPPEFDAMIGMLFFAAAVLIAPQKIKSKK